MYDGLHHYTYDAWNRLTMVRHAVSATDSDSSGIIEPDEVTTGSITSRTHEQDWTLDELGNWDDYLVDDDGDGTDDLEQTRTHNAANEITGITETQGSSWIDSAYDAAGNTTLTARPGDEADANDGLILVYDAWNRLVAVHDDNDGDGEIDGGELLVTYEYDGANRRIVEDVESGSKLDNYYNANWQLIEVHEDGDTTNPLKQYIWDQQYIDALVVRFYDADTDGSAVAHYATFDANMNLTAILDASGNVVERYHYDAYGQSFVLDADWSSDADGASDVDNRTLFTGYHYDSETGLYLARHRVYHATLGRFIQRDPLGYVDGMSAYAGYFVMHGGVDPLGQLVGAQRIDILERGMDLNRVHIQRQQDSARSGFFLDIDLKSFGLDHVGDSTIILGIELTTAGELRLDYDRLARSIQQLGLSESDSNILRGRLKREIRRQGGPLSTALVRQIRQQRIANVRAKHAKGIFKNPRRQPGSAWRPNPKVTATGRAFCRAGQGLVLAGFVIEATNVISADNPLREAALAGGRLAGAAAGFQLGAMACSWGGPWGVGICGTGGAIVGSILGEEAVKWLADEIPRIEDIRDDTGRRLGDITIPDFLEGISGIRY